MFAPRQPLRPIGGLATALVALLVAQMALLVVQMIALIRRSSLVSAVDQGHIVDRLRLEAADNAVQTPARLILLTLTATIVVWCVWQHRAQRNAIELNGGGLEYTPGWAVGWWFIPIANLFKPFQAMRELWKASHGGTWRALPTWALIGWWWGVWIASSVNVWVGSKGVQAGVTFGMPDEQLSLQDFAVRDRWTMAWFGVRVIAAALAIVIVRSVVRLQAKADAARTVVPVPPAPMLVEAGDVGLALPPPPPAAPAGVTDTMTAGERILILTTVTAMVCLAAGGIVWSARDQPLTAAGAAPTPAVLTPAAPTPHAASTPSHPSPTDDSDFGVGWKRDGVTLTYPTGWTTEPVDLKAQAGVDPLWTVGFTPEGYSNLDLVIVSAYPLPVDASTYSSDARSAAVGKLVAEAVSGVGGHVTSEVNPTVFGGQIPGDHVTADLTIEGQPVSIDFNALFAGAGEYSVVCQSTPRARAVIATGCGQIRTTFVVKS